MATIQRMRKIGACENAQAQAAEWTGPAIDPCPAPAAFLCEVCAFMLCGGHASGHKHTTGDKAVLSSELAQQLQAAEVKANAAQANAAKLEAQLAQAQQAAQQVTNLEAQLNGKP